MYTLERKILGEYIEMSWKCNGIPFSISCRNSDSQFIHNTSYISFHNVCLFSDFNIQFAKSGFMNKEGIKLIINVG